MRPQLLTGLDDKELSTQLPLIYHSLINAGGSIKRIR